MWDIIGDIDKSISVFEIMFSRSLDNGETWSEPAFLIETALSDEFDNHYPVVKSNHNGTWIAAWCSYSMGSKNIMFSRSENNGTTWSLPLNLDADALYVIDFYKPDLAYLGNGEWQCAWTVSQGETEFDNDVMSSKSIDDGKTWSTPVFVNSDALIDDKTLDDRYPRLALLQNGHVLSAWWTFNPIYEPRSHLRFSKTEDGEVWSPFVAFNYDYYDYDQNSEFSLAVDDQMAITALAYQAAFSSNFGICIIKSLDGGVTWTEPIPVFKDDSDKKISVYYPKVFNDSNNTWLVVWTSSERVEMLNGYYVEYYQSIMYSYSTDNGSNWSEARTAYTFPRIDKIYVKNVEAVSGLNNRWILTWISNEQAILDGDSEFNESDIHYNMSLPPPDGDIWMIQ